MRSVLRRSVRQPRSVVWWVNAELATATLRLERQLDAILDRMEGRQA